MNQLTTTNDGSTRPDLLFQHTARPDWGLAILAWERDDKRGYQFEDGQLRVFKDPYFKFLAPVDRPADESARVLAELGKAIGRERASKRLGAAHAPIPLATQLAYFTSRYPEGFEGSRWTKQHRGTGVRTPLKRHRDAVLQRAAELLAPARLEAELAAGRAEAVVGELCGLLDATDLVSKAQAKGLDRVDAATAERLVRSLHALLTTEGPVATVFDAWVGAIARVIGRKPTWALVTALPALAQPARLTAVKRSTFAPAAAWLAPSLVLEVQPSGHSYQRVLDMVETLATKLGEAGLQPRDRIDLFDFIQVTLTPKAIKAMTAEANDDAPAAPVAANGDATPDATADDADDAAA